MSDTPDPRIAQLAALRARDAQLVQQITASSAWQERQYLKGKIDLLVEQIAATQPQETPGSPHDPA